MGELEIVREFSSRGDAEVVRELLLANGVEAFVVSDDCGSVDPALSFARGVRLLVASADLERAEEIIGQSLSGADAEGAELDGEATGDVEP